MGDGKGRVGYNMLQSREDIKEEKVEKEGVLIKRIRNYIFILSEVWILLIRSKLLENISYK